MENGKIKTGDYDMNNVDGMLKDVDWIKEEKPQRKEFDHKLRTKNLNRIDKEKRCKFI